MFLILVILLIFLIKSSKKWFPGRFAAKNVLNSLKTSQLSPETPPALTKDFHDSSVLETSLEQKKVKKGIKGRKMAEKDTKSIKMAQKRPETSQNGTGPSLELPGTSKTLL